MKNINSIILGTTNVLLLFGIKMDLSPNFQEKIK